MEVFSPYYFGPVSYYATLLKAEHPVFDIYENYRKQSYRNRMEIYAAHGKYPLIVPVEKPKGGRVPVKDIKISYRENWQKHHWRTLFSAYNNSPFFLYYRDDLLNVYEKKFTFLLDLNLESISIVQKLLGVNLDFSLSTKYQDAKDVRFSDYRDSFSPKEKNITLERVYAQVFEEKHHFIPDLSVLDLLFNEGNQSILYLQ